LNKEVIAVNQDKEGRQGDRVALWPCPGGSEGQLTCQVWAKPLADGSFAAVLLNKGTSTHTITFNFSTVGIPAASEVAVRDLWEHKNLGLFKGSYSASVAPHGVVMVHVMRKSL